MTEASSSAPDQAAKQRRRSAADVSDAVIEAVREELAEVGYQGLTMVGVARRAGASRRALYIRWDTKEQMIYDSVVSAVPTAVSFVSTGDLRRDLIRHVRRMTVFEGSLGQAMRSMIAETYRDPDSLTGGVRERLMAVSSSTLRQLLLEAIARNEALPPALDPEVLTVVDAIVFYQHCTSPDAISEEFASRLVDRVLLPLVARAEYRASSPATG